MLSAKLMLGTLMLPQPRASATVMNISDAGMITSARSALRPYCSMRSSLKAVLLYALVNAQLLEL